MHQLRRHEPLHSPRRRSLLFTVTSKFWSSSRHQEILDASGRPVLELRRQLWQRIWRVKKAGGGGDDLLSAEMGCGMGMKIAVRMTNALLETSQSDEYHQQLLWPHTGSYVSRRAAASRRSTNPPPREPSPPPYSAVIAGDHPPSSDRNNPSCPTECDSRSVYPNQNGTVLPPYDSVRRPSGNSLQNLLDAVESPQEPAPTSSYAFPPARRYSEAAVGEKIELKVLGQTSAVRVVMMGDREIIRIRREKVIYYSLSRLKPRWEVEIAEGVDLLLVSFAAS